MHNMLVFFLKKISPIFVALIHAKYFPRIPWQKSVTIIYEIFDMNFLPRVHVHVVAKTWQKQLSQINLVIIFPQFLQW